MSTKKIKEQLLELLDDYRDFNSGPITVQPIPTAVEFAKQVSKGYPCLYQAYTKTKDDHGNIHVTVDPSLLEYPAFTWTKQDLTNSIDEEVEVAVTPTGRADDLHHVDGQDESIFLAPASINMTIQGLLDKLTPPSIQPPSAAHHTQANSTSNPIYYLQSQNSNLTTTPLRRLLKHIPPTLPFADSVLSPQPEATNIWIGTHQSTTSLHRDPYENLYLVLKGCKTFTLYPPVDELTLPIMHVRTGKHVYDPVSSSFSVALDEADPDPDEDKGDPGEAESKSPPRIPWVSIDPSLPREELIARHSMYAFSSPRTFEVSEGQVLYLPSGWYHHVVQRCGVWNGVVGEEADGDAEVAPCIAINYWYDMEYEGEKYVMRQLIGRLAGMLEEEEKEGMCRGKRERYHWGTTS